MRSDEVDAARADITNGQPSTTAVTSHAPRRTLIRTRTRSAASAARWSLVVRGGQCRERHSAEMPSTAQLLVDLPLAQGSISSSGNLDGLGKFCENLEDYPADAPKAQA